MTRLSILCTCLSILTSVNSLIAQNANPGPAPIAPAVPQPPEWALRISPEEQKWIEQVLQYWEARSETIKTFECKFKRWDYDPVFGPKNEAKTYAEGSIKYAQPDKGLFRVEKLHAYAPPAKAGDPPSYVQQDPSFGEHWICDGKQVFAFEAPKKQLTVTRLPPEMQGRAIVDGPLPFLFGAKAQTIQARYWIHGLAEQQKKDLLKSLPGGPEAYFCLEAVPKARQDAQNFSMVWIVLDNSEFLPQIIQVFAPNFNPQTNPSRQTYVFFDRKASDQASIATAIGKGFDPLGLFHREFFEPKLPTGWKKVVQADVGPPPQEVSRPAAPQRQPAPVAR
jgi:TIGR03009 family protein